MFRNPDRVWLDWPQANKGDPVFDEPPENSSQAAQTCYIRADIARAQIEAAVKAEREIMLSWAAKRSAISRLAWAGDARAALAGDMRGLRTRIAMIDAEPMEIVQSDDAAVQAEREACAAVADQSEIIYGARQMNGAAKCARNIAAAIRARTDTQEGV